MARPLIIPNSENATIEEFKQLSRVGSSETATRCTATQMLLAGVGRELVCNALLITTLVIGLYQLHGFLTIPVRRLSLGPLAPAGRQYKDRENNSLSDLSTSTLHGGRSWEPSRSIAGNVTSLTVSAARALLDSAPTFMSNGPQPAVRYLGGKPCA